MDHSIIKLAVSGVFFVLPFSASADQMIPESELVCTHTINEQITTSTVDRLRAAFDASPETFREPVSALCLNSPGGSLVAGLEIARFANQEIIRTVIRSDATCLSACAIAFLGGAGAIGMWSYPSRTLYPGGDLGFHAPDINLAPGTYTPDEVRSAYAIALETVSAVLDFGQTRYLTGSQTVMNDFLIRNFITTTPVGDNFWRPQTVEDAIKADIGLGVIGLPVSPETYTNVCDNFVSRYGWDGVSPTPTQQIVNERVANDFTTRDVVTDGTYAWVGGYWRGGRNTMVCRVSLEPTTTYAASDSFLVSLIEHEWGATYPLEDGQEYTTEFFRASASAAYTYTYDTVISEILSIR